MVLDFINYRSSYNPEVFAANNIENSVVFAVAVIAWVGGLSQMIAALVAGFKHKTHGVPMICVFWFFAHDATYFMNYNHWFHGTPYKMTQSAWYQMGFYMVVELIVLCQIVIYSRREVLPKMGIVAAIFSFIGMQAFAFVLLWWVLSILNDPLWVYTITSTVVILPLFLMAMLHSRGSQKGFNLVSVGGVTLNALGFWPWLFLSDPYFQQPVIVSIAIGNLLMSIACLFYYLKLPKYLPT